MSVTRRTARIVAALVVASGPFVLGAPASAAGGSGTNCTETQVGDEIIWNCESVDEGHEETGPGGGGPVEPPCDLRDGYDELCIDEDACWMNDPAAVQDPEELRDTPKPSEDSYVVYVSCIRPNGDTYDRWYWSDDVPTITIEDRIRAAMGSLRLPTIEATFNPPGRTLVNLPTWWWAEGAPTGEIRGTEALGMVGIAIPRGLSVTPGDGTASFSCPMVVTKSDVCSYQYRRAGSYTATMSIVYDVQFSMNGQIIDASQIPAELRSVTVDDSTTVTVREVQTKVTRVD